MKTNPGIEELEDKSAFEKILTLNYNEIAPFVIGQIAKVSLPMILIWIMAAISMALSVLLWPGLLYPPANQGILKGMFLGLILMPILLIPVHEGSHLLPFSIAGARDIRFGADLRQGIIYVTANRFVAGQRLFAVVALTPFIVITITLMLLIIFSGPWWKWVFSLALLIHTTMCAGDAALLGYMHSFSGRSVYTWDDADRREAYFYASVQSPVAM